jgi:hypothetical protein
MAVGLSQSPLVETLMMKGNTTTTAAKALHRFKVFCDFEEGQDREVRGLECSGKMEQSIMNS